MITRSPCSRVIQGVSSLQSGYRGLPVTAFLVIPSVTLYPFVSGITRHCVPRDPFCHPIPFCQRDYSSLRSS